MSWVEVGGCRIRYEVSGPEDAPLMGNSPGGAVSMQMLVDDPPVSPR